MFTKHNWIESSYNEDSSEEMIYYVADNCKAGDNNCKAGNNNSCTLRC